MAKEIKPQERYIDSIQSPTQEYGQSQEPIDYKRLRNRNFGEKQTIVNNTSYYTKVAGRVVASAGSGNIYTIIGYNDDNSTPTTMVGYAAMNAGVGTNAQLSITFPVTANSYYRVNSGAGLTLGYFIPL